MKRSQTRRYAMGDGRRARTAAAGKGPTAPDGPPAGDDVDTDEFARVLRRLEPHLPISDGYEALALQRGESHWSSQQEHMVGWFEGQSSHGSGQYTRTTPNRSARTAYNRLLSAFGLLWIAEALGEEPGVVQKAADAARAEPDYRRRCGQIRRVVPWSRILELWNADAEG